MRSPSASVLRSGAALLLTLVCTANAARANEPTAPSAAATPLGRPLAEEIDLSFLMQRFGELRGLKARFREEKRIALLNEPLVSQGWLYVVPPDRVLFETTLPAPARLTISGDRLAMEDELGREEIDLASQPRARQFVDHMLILFSGDIERIRANYEAEFSAKGDDWTLALVPRDLLMRRIISRVELGGSGPALRSMVVSEPGGDSTHTHFDRVEIDRVFAESEIATLFGAAPEPARPSDSSAATIPAEPQLR
jgi:hypothetical protein